MLKRWFNYTDKHYSFLMAMKPVLKSGKGHMGAL
jgi:hypothetical protein